MLDLIVLAVIILYGFNGLRRGLILSVFSIVGYFVSLIVARALSPRLTEYIIKNTEITNWIDGFVSGKVRNISQIDIPTNVVTDFAANTILGVICFFIIFSITSVIIFNIGQFANRVGKLPVIGHINRFGGLIFGTIKGLLLIFIILALISFVVKAGDNRLKNTIENTVVVEAMYENNPIIYLISEILEPLKNNNKQYMENIKNTISSL